VLDLYAGSGALAIEALSRGAAHAVLVERARAPRRAIEHNLGELELRDRTTVLGCELARAWVAIGRSGPYGLVLADPPYAQAAAAAAVLRRLLDRPELLTAGARLVLEHARRDEPPLLAGAVGLATKRYGDTAVSIYQAP